MEGAGTARPRFLNLRARSMNRRMRKGLLSPALSSAGREGEEATAIGAP